MSDIAARARYEQFAELHRGPVNVLVSPRDTATLAELQTIGVRRVSLGVDPYTHALGSTQKAAAKLAKGDLTALASNLNFGHIIDLIKG